MVHSEHIYFISDFLAGLIFFFILMLLTGLVGNKMGPKIYLEDIVLAVFCFPISECGALSKYQIDQNFTAV